MIIRDLDAIQRFVANGDIDQSLRMDITIFFVFIILRSIFYQAVYIPSSLDR